MVSTSELVPTGKSRVRTGHRCAEGENVTACPVPDAARSICSLGQAIAVHSVLEDDQGGNRYTRKFRNLTNGTYNLPTK